MDAIKIKGPTFLLTAGAVAQVVERVIYQSAGQWINP